MVRTPSRLPIAVVIVVMLASSTAHATLGASYASVDLDRIHMSAQHSASSKAGYTLHTLTSASSVLHEYTGPDGKVFAVSWQGQARPDLRQALGPYFDELNAANPPRTRGGRHIPLAANRADLVVRSGGHSGAFWGVAYVPGMMPAGISPADLH